MKKLIIATSVVAIALIATYIFGADGPSAPPIQDTHKPDIPPETLVDTDQDGFSDWFEENIAGYNPAVSNDRYFLYCEYLPEIEKESDVAFNLAWRVLVGENGVPSQNIVRLTGEKATRSNLQKEIEEIAVLADDNDIALIGLLGHGGYDSIACCYDGNILYSEIDEWLDEIRAKVVIVQVNACKSECAAETLKDGPCPRIVLTGGFSMEGFYNEETADEYPWLPTYADYGYDNPAPALDYYDIFFGFADKMGSRDGYMSLGEFIKVLKMDVETRWYQEEWNKITDYSWWDVARDESGIADRIYLVEHSPKENIFWETFHNFND